MKNKFVFALIAILLTGSIAYYLGNKGNEDQNKLVGRLKRLSSQEIVSITILGRTVINDPSVIEKVKKCLVNVDRTAVGGHNIPINESTFLFKLGYGSVKKFYASCYTAYEFNKDSVYFVAPGTEDKIAYKPARVPGLKSIVFD